MCYIDYFNKRFEINAIDWLTRVLLAHNAVAWLHICISRFNRVIVELRQETNEYYALSEVFCTQHHVSPPTPTTAVLNGLNDFNFLDKSSQLTLDSDAIFSESPTCTTSHPIRSLEEGVSHRFTTSHHSGPCTDSHATLRWQATHSYTHLAHTNV